MLELAGLVISALTALLPLLGSTTSGIGEVIALLVKILPTAVNEAEDLVPLIQNVITALTSNTSVTPAQMTALQALQAQVDLAFEAAAAAAGDPESA